MRGNSHAAWENASQIAADQWGNATARQLVRAGLSADAIERAVHNHRLFRPHERVYAFGHPPTMPKERAMAAVLSQAAGWEITTVTYRMVTTDWANTRRKLDRLLG